MGLFFALALLAQACSTLPRLEPHAVSPTPLTPAERAQLPDRQIQASHKIHFTQNFLPLSHFSGRDFLEIGGKPANLWSLGPYLELSGRPDLKQRFDDGTWLRFLADWGAGSGILLAFAGQAFKNETLRAGFELAGAGAIIGSLPISTWGYFKRDGAVNDFNSWLGAVPASGPQEAPVPAAPPQSHEAPAKNKDELFYRAYRVKLLPFSVGGIAYREDLIDPYLDKVGRPDLKEPIRRAEGLAGVSAVMIVLGGLGVLWSADQALPQEGATIDNSLWPVIQNVFWSSAGLLTIGLGLRAYDRHWVRKIEFNYNEGLKAKYKLQF